MPFDVAFLGTTKPVRIPRRGGMLRDMARFADQRERCEVVGWIAGMAPWDSSFDFTFGSRNWRGRSSGRRKEQRDGLLVAQRYGRGLDPDDALDLHRRFMHRVLPGKSWIAAIEPNPDQFLNPGHHGHGMFCSGGDVFFKAVHDKWVSENGWAKVNPIRSSLGRECYCTKHLAGRGLVLGYEIYSEGQLAPELVESL